MSKYDEVVYQIFLDRNKKDRCAFCGCADIVFEVDQQMWCVADYLTREKGKVYLGNAFSLQMVAPNAICTVLDVAPEDIPKEAISVIGHPDTAAVVSNVLGRDIPYNRQSILLEDGDVLYVAQLMGGRLPEGVTKLPEGFTLSFRRVVVHC